MSSVGLFASSEAQRSINEKEIQGHQRHRMYKYAQSKGQILRCTHEGMDFMRIIEVLMCVFNAAPAERGRQEGGERKVRAHRLCPCPASGKGLHPATGFAFPRGISPTPRLGSPALLSPSVLSSCGWLRSACTQLNYSEELVTQSFS